ncbi:MAG TPA: thioredoxin domain-containing protein [Candidatus Saccharimonadia bacterium]|nr:thioredoxin domain-containing protein [Candidatus Saccharimonadia bacterium]
MDKRFWAVIGVIVVVFGGILVFHGNKQDNNGSSGAKPTNHVEGKLDSKVTLVEYGDYECPVCEGYFATVQQVQQKYNDSVKFQFRNLPLSQIHPNAIAGARTAEAADLQGKFWQMHDLLYNQTNWQDWSSSNNPEPLFWNYAKELGLNVTKFKSDFASSKVNDRIQADVAEFAKTKQQEATPTFFLNGTYISNTKLVDNTGQPSVANFSQLLDAALKNAK